MKILGYKTIPKIILSYSLHFMLSTTVPTTHDCSLTCLGGKHPTGLHTPWKGPHMLSCMSGPWLVSGSPTAGFSFLLPSWTSHSVRLFGCCSLLTAMSAILLQMFKILIFFNFFSSGFFYFTHLSVIPWFLFNKNQVYLSNTINLRQTYSQIFLGISFTHWLHTHSCVVTVVIQAVFQRLGYANTREIRFWIRNSIWKVV